MLPSSLLCSEIGALVALYLLLKYLSKTQNSFANIKEERVKKKIIKMDCWDYGTRKGK